MTATKPSRRQRAADQILRRLHSDRLLRCEWTDGDRVEDGYERACLLAAAAPEIVGEDRIGDPALCPAEILPQWLADLTPWIDDSGSLELWPEHVERYAAALSRSDVLGEGAWHRLELRVRGLAYVALRRLAAVHAPELLPLVDKCIEFYAHAVADDGDLLLPLLSGLIGRLRREMYLGPLVYRVKDTTAGAVFAALDSIRTADDPIGLGDFTTTAVIACRLSQAAEDCRDLLIEAATDARELGEDPGGQLLDAALEHPSGDAIADEVIDGILAAWESEIGRAAEAARP